MCWLAPLSLLPSAVVVFVVPSSQLGHTEGGGEGREEEGGQPTSRLEREMSKEKERTFPLPPFSFSRGRRRGLSKEKNRVGAMKSQVDKREDMTRGEKIVLLVAKKK